MESAVRTATALRHAFLNYQPRRYDGAVVFLCSRNKAKLIEDHRSEWRPFVGDKVEVEMLADLHLDLFLPRNSRLGRTIDRMLKSRDL
jgi:hypothetical protein